MATAFQPLPEHRHPDSLGSVYVNDTTEANLRELVADSPHPDFVFVVDNPAVENVLLRHPALQTVPLPVEVPAPAPAEVSVDNLDGMTKDDLLKQPEADRLEGAKGLRVDDLRDKVRALRQGGDA